MGHAHHHHNHSEGNIKVAFFLNLTFSIIELIGGIWTNSVAILSDALHDFGDSLTLGVSWYFAKIAKKERTRQFSYGYGRFSLLGALINAIVLLTGSIFILTEAIPRLMDPVNPKTSGMIYLAIGGVLFNGLAVLKLKNGKTLNERVVYTHLLEDILGWVAILLGAIVMNFYDLPIIDPLLSIGIAAYILINIYKNLKESIKIFLQATPAGIDVKDVQKKLKSLPSVKNVHDCHLWSMDGDFHILSVHLIIADNLKLSELSQIKQDAKKRMNEMGISHTTIEFETAGENCDPC